MDPQAKWTNIFIAFETDLLALLVKLEENQVSLVQQTKLTDFQSNKDNFLQVLDEALASFYDHSGSEAKDSIFIVSQDWLIANDLTPTRKAFLKEAKKALELQVNGFVVLEEALTFALKKRLLTDPSYILFTVLPGLVSLTQVELGRVSQHVSVGRSDDLKADITEALSRLQESVKPLRVIFINLSSLSESDLKHQVNQLNWQTELGFPQEPKIEFWTTKQMIEQLLMVVFGEAKNQQVKVTWATDKVITPTSQAPTQSADLPPPTPDTQSDKIAPTLTKPSQPPESPPDSHTPTKDDSPTTEPESTATTPDQPDLTKLGVVLPTSQPTTHSATPDEAPPPDDKADSQPAVPQRFKVKLPTLNLKTIKPLAAFGLIGGLLAKLGRILPAGAGWGVRLTSWLAPLILIPIIGASLYYAFFSAQITITPKTSTIKRSLTVKFDTQATQADPVKGVIPARQIKFEVTKKAQAPTTGRSQQGEPGQGIITIYNKSSKEKEFKEGTQLYLDSDKTKKVVLLETVKVASQSSQTNENEVTTLIPGKVQAKAKTSFWGEEANLPQNTQLYFVGLDKDVYKAKVTQAFSGGKKYEVRSVSEDDVARLKEDIQSQIQASVDQLVKDQLESGEAVVDTSLKIKAVKTNLSHKVGEAAENVSLESQNQVVVLAYQQADLKALIDQAIADITPAGFEINKDQINWQFKPKDDQSYQLDLSIGLTWSFDTETIKANLAGKDKNSAYFYLQNLPGIFAFKITFKPPVPPALQRMPYRADNIIIQVQ